MERTVYFLDTSILLNILRVPKRCQHAEEVKDDFEKLRQGKHTMILPRGIT